MTQLTRRDFFGFAAAGAALAAGMPSRAACAEAKPAGAPAGAPPITPAERALRVAKLQSHMQRDNVAALLVEAGSSLEYFTGIRWWRSERTTAALIPASGQVVVVTPFFEVPSVRESLEVDADIRPWHEDQDPFALIADATKGYASGAPLAVEGTTRFFIVDHARAVPRFGRPVVSGEALVNACRMIKSPAEIALIQSANDVTLAAIRHAHREVKNGMTGPDIRALLYAQLEASGCTDLFGLVLINEASAYPHGTDQPQAVRDGSIVLVDVGCRLHGYSADISRTWVQGEPTKRQREVWDTVLRGQEIVLETARVGRPVGDLDIAVRDFYEGLGWAKDYGLPGTSHRAGHGIGMDVHEPPNLMRADRTPLEAGMCFSNEPGIYIPGEFGVRLEDIWQMTAGGPKLFTPLAKSIDEPV
jgi:Xaa-Pro dipeptidase